MKITFTDVRRPEDDAEFIQVRAEEAGPDGVLLIQDAHVPDKQHEHFFDDLERAVGAVIEDLERAQARVNNSREERAIRAFVDALQDETAGGLNSVAVDAAIARCLNGAPVAATDPANQFDRTEPIEA